MQNERVNKCAGGYDVVINACVIAMVSIAVAAVAHKAT